MDYGTIFSLAEPFLKKNDFGLPHTRRVYDIAKNNFAIPKDIEELVCRQDDGGSDEDRNSRADFAPGTGVAINFRAFIGPSLKAKPGENDRLVGTGPEGFTNGKEKHGP